MGNIINSYKKNKFKILPKTWHKEFESPDRSYFTSDIQNYFEYILKKHGEKTVNPSNINQIEIRITCKIKAGYYHKLLTPEKMKLLGCTKSKITEDENGENVPYLEILEVVLIHTLKDAF